jgi:hypothetical protein
MNPYFEQDDTWHKFHEQFCIHCMETLVAQIGDAYVVNVDEHIYTHEIPGDERRLARRTTDSISATVQPCLVACSRFQSIQRNSVGAMRSLYK